MLPLVKIQMNPLKILRTSQMPWQSYRWNAIMMAPVISLFAIVGVAMVTWTHAAMMLHISHDFQLSSPYFWRGWRICSWHFRTTWRRRIRYNSFELCNSTCFIWSFFVGHFFQLLIRWLRQPGDHLGGEGGVLPQFDIRGKRNKFETFEAMNSC